MQSLFWVLDYVPWCLSVLTLQCSQSILASGASRMHCCPPKQGAKWSPSVEFQGDILKHWLEKNEVWSNGCSHANLPLATLFLCLQNLKNRSQSTGALPSLLPSLGLFFFLTLSLNITKTLLKWEIQCVSFRTLQRVYSWKKRLDCIESTRSWPVLGGSFSAFQSSGSTWVQTQCHCLLVIRPTENCWLCFVIYKMDKVTVLVANILASVK